MEKIKVIYIGPTGRSGSTLLDLLLNNHPAIQSVGELMFLDKWLDKDLLCSCKKPISKCGFWCKILNSLPEGNKFRLNYRDPSNKFVRILNNLTYYDFVSKDILKNVQKNYYLLLSAVKKHTNSEFIVDSSKMLSRLKIYAKSDLFDVYFLHLIRDPVAVMQSCSVPRIKHSFGANHFTPAVNPVRTALRWTFSNISAELFARKQIHYRKVFYEELVSSPEKVLLEIYKWIGVESHGTVLTYPITENIHNISGSRWRFQKDVRIKFDKNYRKKIPFSMKLSFLFIGGFLSFKYRYPLL